MSEDQLASLIYLAHSGGGYGRTFETATNKAAWRSAAAAVIDARETGRL